MLFLGQVELLKSQCYEKSLTKESLRIVLVYLKKKIVT